MTRGEKREHRLDGETLGELQQRLFDQRATPLPKGYQPLPLCQHEKQSVLHFLWRDRDGWYAAPHSFENPGSMSAEAVAIAWRDVDTYGPFRSPEEAIATSLDVANDWIKDD